ncbi:VPLPA-CTERM sorting domain-containing protein [Roseobacter litoralis]|uniref:PEP-CTERM protein-sorting domain-containing protein n=1 Tax=Roseobacter litoralis (strain ATCC 49566 / DSM 6996 / JCM 21268 / NBRC 15278 / OCh 149) TaxID=391595 RepID=F7ZAL1_ROSLO|nr:VPLPA-CTERM sorting domain-containing protein [Roseobacter litoralis]AEI93011.1 hypothetical protein RLO149_c010000 [Roseobacter litoralis Och 149]
MLRTTVAAAALLSFGSVAHATTITAQVFTPTDFANLTNGAVVEDFELSSILTGTFANTQAVRGVGSVEEGELSGDLTTKVGTFGSLWTAGDLLGSGSTCSRFDLGAADCNGIALQKSPDDTNGQGNIVPDNGNFAINSNDTQGIVWNAALAGGTLFTTLVFAIQDAADVGAKTLTVELGDGTKAVFSGSLFGNNDTNIVKISFDAGVASAEVSIETSRNDAFTVDGAAISPVPLPASSLLLIGGMAALAGVARRRKNKKA